MRRCYYEVFGSDIGISEQFIKEPNETSDEDPTNIQWEDASIDTLIKGEPDYLEYSKREDAWWTMKT
jgi:hypothetical protein